jgi:hypothetical protein
MRHSVALLTRTLDALTRLDNRFIRGGTGFVSSRHRTYTIVGIVGLGGSLQMILRAAADYKDFFFGFVQGVVGGIGLVMGVVLLVMARRERMKHDDT